MEQEKDKEFKVTDKRSTFKEETPEQSKSKTSTDASKQTEEQPQEKTAQASGKDSSPPLPEANLLNRQNENNRSKMFVINFGRRLNCLIMIFLAKVHALNDGIHGYFGQKIDYIKNVEGSSLRLTFVSLANFPFIKTQLET